MGRWWVCDVEFRIKWDTASIGINVRVEVFALLVPALAILPADNAAEIMLDPAQVGRLCEWLRGARDSFLSAAKKQ